MSGKSVFVFAHSGSYTKPLFRIKGVNGICIDVPHDDGKHARTINNIREMFVHSQFRIFTVIVVNAIN